MIRLIKFITYLSIFIGLLFLLSFTEKRHNNFICQGVKISMQDEDRSFITKGEILNILESIVDSIELFKLADLPLNKIEKIVEDNNFLESAEVYLLPDGELNISVNQKVPIVRVLNIDGDSYYLDAKGIRFPLSSNYTQRVIIATGSIIDTVHSSSLIKLVRVIQNNSFLEAQIAQIHFNQNNDIELIPRVGMHRILLGDTTDMKHKFHKLMLYYKHGVQQLGWNKYSMINLKYKNQLVCVKK